MMNWKECGRKRSWLNLSNYLKINLEGPRKITKDLSQYSRSPGPDLKPGAPENEEGALPTRPRRWVPFRTRNINDELENTELAFYCFKSLSHYTAIHHGTLLNTYILQ
jgi:hypothetical protein